MIKINSTKVSISYLEPLNFFLSKSSFMNFNPLKHIMSQNGQTNFKNLAAFAARFLKFV